MTGDMVLFAANGTLAYIGDSKKGTVEIYDTAKHTVKDTIHRQAGDQLFSVSEDGDMLLFYTHPSNGSPFYTTYRISKGTAATFERNTKGGELTSDMHISKDGTTIYATAGAPGDSHLVAWDANTGKQSFSTRIPDTTDGSFIQGFANKGRSLIIYVYGNADGDGFKIVRYNIDTKQFTKLADSDGRLLGFNSQCSQFTYLQKASNGATGSSSNAHDLETEDTMSGKITHSIKAPRALTDSETAAGLSADGSILYFVSYTKIRGESGDGQKPAEYTSVLHAMNLADGSTSEASQSIFGEVMLSADDSTLVQYTDPASDAFYNNVDSKRGIYVFNTHLPRNTVASATNSKLAVPLPLLIGTAAAVVILIAAAITLLLHRRHRVRARVNANATATAQTGAGAPSGGSPQFAQPAQPSQPIWPGTANQPYTADQPGMANQPSQPSQQPVQSVISAQPIQPVAPAQFAMPAQPAMPIQPNQSATPTQLSTPIQPDAASQTNARNWPGQPGTQSQPGMPWQPNQSPAPTQPGAQRQPSKPNLPTQAATAGMSRTSSQQPAQSAPSASAPSTPTPKFCRHCGAPVRAQSAFCANCGKPVN
jgi:hypothetical protein